ncbi:hypothetical protein REPUB_Repub04eG0169400 [Reevesia pubescens]
MNSMESECGTGPKTVEELDYDSEDEMEGTYEGIPTVKIAPHLKKTLRNPWRHGFYVVKFENMEDRLKVMTGGPWKIMDHYLTVQRWQPYFRHSVEVVGAMVAWIQLPKLPLKFFNGELLMNIGKIVGNPLKLDSNTILVTREKFARTCFEIDLQKPLVSRVVVARHDQRIEYEGLHIVDFNYGIVGHRAKNYPTKPMEVNTMAEIANKTSTNLVEDGGTWCETTVRDSKGKPNFFKSTQKSSGSLQSMPTQRKGYSVSATYLNPVFTGMRETRTSHLVTLDLMEEDGNDLALFSVQKTVANDHPAQHDLINNILID